MQNQEYDPYRPPGAPLGPPDPVRVEAEVPEGSPFETIWTRPRGTIRGIVASDPTLHVLPLAALSGFSNGLGQLAQSGAGETLPMPGLFALAFVLGGLFGVLGIYLMGALVRLTGGWLEGTATSREVRAALAWSSLPQVAALPFLLLGMAAFRQEFFRPDALNGASPEKGLLLGLIAVAMLALSFWGAFLNVKCVAEVHRFSAWRSLAATLLAVALVVAAFLAIVAVVAGIGLVSKVGG